MEENEGTTEIPLWIVMWMAVSAVVFLYLLIDTIVVLLL